MNKTKKKSNINKSEKKKFIDESPMCLAFYRLIYTYTYNSISIRRYCFQQMSFYAYMVGIIIIIISFFAFLLFLSACSKICLSLYNIRYSISSLCYVILLEYNICFISFFCIFFFLLLFPFYFCQPTPVSAA